MAEYSYSHKDRSDQLAKLQAVLEALILHLHRTGHFRDKARVYERVLREAQRLEASTFDESEILKLGRNIPDLFQRSKAWRPPLDLDENGKWVHADWFIELEGYLQPVLAIARKLRTISTN